jgi:hypothetical protein
MSAGPVYSHSEVVFLLSLPARLLHTHFIDADVRSCSTNWGQFSTSAGEEQPLPLVVRWHDVHLARHRVRAALSAEHDRAVELRVNGATEEEVADRLDVSEATARRRFISTIDAILAELGGELVDTEAPSKPSACLECGQRPRCRVVTYGPKLRGKPRPRSERQAALCTECLAAAAERAGRPAPETTTLLPTLEAAA